MPQTTVPPTLSILFVFETMSTKFTHNPQPDTTGTGTEQKKHSCDIGGKHSYIIFFVFCLQKLMVAWSFVEHKSSEGDLILHIAWGYSID